MYNIVSVDKLSDTQKSKLRNGHSTRIKKGSGNQLHLTNEQLKKFEAAGRKGKAYTVTLNPEQAEKHGSGLFGNIAAKMKRFAIKHKDVLNPMIAGLKTGAKRGATKLAQAAQDKVVEFAQKAQDNIDSKINPIEGGAVKRRGRGRPKKGEGFGMLLGPLIKLAAPAIIDAVAGVAKKKMSGRGRKKDGGALLPAGSKGAGFSRKPRKTRAKSAYRKRRSGGALFPA